jgi:hypothetical protein
MAYGLEKNVFFHSQLVYLGAEISTFYKLF